MKILIIDSSYLMYKSFFAFQKSHLSVEIENTKIITSAIFGYIREIISMNNNIGYDFIISVWDSPPYKKKMKYSSYKEGRKARIPNLQYEKEIIQGTLDDLKIPCLYSEGYEAEDVINSLKKKLKGEKIDIFGNDEDMYALLNKNVSMITTRSSEIVMTDYKDVYNKYGVTPKQFHLFKTLTGCASDEVKGASDIGKKRASYIINKSGAKTIKEVLGAMEEYPEQISSKLKKAVEENIFESSSYLTKIFSPKTINNIKQKTKLSYVSLLEFIEARTLLKGSNRLTLKLIKKKQRIAYKTIKEKINWKTKRR